jgi:glycosyltransferase involved in cell wall biosynthesis
MKILHIAPCFVDIDNESGGVSNIIRQICLKLEKKGINTILICTNTFLGKIVCEPRSIKYSKFLTIHIIKQNKFPLFGPIYPIKSLLETIDNIDLVHIHTNFSIICDFSIKYYTKNKIPSIFTPHGKLSPTIFSNFLLLKYVYFHLFSFSYLKNITQIISSSSNEMKYLYKLGFINNNNYFIHNGFSIFNNPISKTYNFGLSKKKYLLFLGYLDPRKQPDLLIKAYAESIAKEKYSLVFAGADSYDFKKNLVKLVELYNIKDNVKFIGHVNNEFKCHLLENAKVLILPSKGEGWPLVIAEAIGAKLPMILSKECNFSEIKNYKIGIEVADFNIKNWTNAIDEVCFNDKVYFEYEKNLDNCFNNFSWDYITNLWLTKYKEIYDKSIN